MKTGMTAILFTVLLSILTTAADSSAAPRVTFSPRTPSPGQNVNFSSSNLETNCWIWDFGDGSPRQSTETRTTMQHSFKKAGTYRVKFWDTFCDDGGPPTLTIAVKIQSEKKKGSISFQPKNPSEGENVSFNGKISDVSCITWDFGDGKKVKDTSPPSISHSFDKPGKYTVRMYADCGKTESGRTSVNVRELNRKLTADKTRANVDETVRFFTRGFQANCVGWDFGNDRMLKGGRNESHSFPKAGRYTVKAYDYCDRQSVKPETIQIQIDDNALAVSRVDLFFDSRKKTAEVATGEQLSGEATLQFNGKGILRYQWLVDNQAIFGIQSLNLMHGGRNITTIKTPEKLPTKDAGQHKLSIVILEPRTNERTPEITYAVLAEQPDITVALQSEKKYKVALLSAADQSGKSLSIEGSEIRVVKNSETQFATAVINGEQNPLSDGLLLTMVDGKQVSSQSVPSVTPGNMQEMIVSVKTTSADSINVEFNLVNKSETLLASLPVTLNSRIGSLAQMPQPAHVRVNFKITPVYIYDSGDTPVLNYEVENIYDAKLYQLTYSTSWWQKIVNKLTGYDIQGDEVHKKLIQTFDARYGGLAIRKGSIKLSPPKIGETDFYEVEYAYFLTPANKTKKEDRWRDDVYGGINPEMAVVWESINLEPTQYYRKDQNTIHLPYDPTKEQHLSLKADLFIDLPTNARPAFDKSCPSARNFKAGFVSLPEDWKGELKTISMHQCRQQETFDATVPKNLPFRSDYKLRFSVDSENKFPPPPCDGISHSICEREKRLSKQRDHELTVTLTNIERYYPKIHAFYPDDGSTTVQWGQPKKLKIEIANADKAVITSDNPSDKPFLLTLKDGGYIGVYTTSPVKNTVYTLTVENDYKTVIDTLKLTMPEGKPVIHQFDFASAKITAGQKARLLIHFENGQKIMLREKQSGKRVTEFRGPDGKTAFVFTPQYSMAYELEVANSNGKATKEAFITVKQDPKLYQDKPFIQSFTADKYEIQEGETVTLSYTFSEADYGEIKSELIGQDVVTEAVLPMPKPGKIMEGKLTVTPKLNKNFPHYYYLVLENGNGPGFKSLQIGVKMKEGTQKLPQMPQHLPGQPTAPVSGQIKKQTTKNTKETAFDKVAPKGLTPGVQGTTQAIPTAKIKEPGLQLSNDPQILAFYFKPEVITLGEKTKLFYEYINGGTSGNYHGDIEDPDDPGKSLVNFTGKKQGKGVLELTPRRTENYHMLVSGDRPGLTDYKMARIIVRQPQGTWNKDKPLITQFKADPATIEKGKQSQLHIGYTYVSDINVYDKATGQLVTTLPVPAPGKTESFSIPVSPIKTTTYLLKAENRNGSDTKETMVIVTEKKGAQPKPLLPDKSGKPGAQQSNQPFGSITQELDSYEYYLIVDFIIDEKSYEPKEAIPCIYRVNSLAYKLKINIDHLKFPNVRSEISLTKRSDSITIDANHFPIPGKYKITLTAHSVSIQAHKESMDRTVTILEEKNKRMEIISFSADTQSIKPFDTSMLSFSIANAQKAALFECGNKNKLLKSFTLKNKDETVSVMGGGGPGVKTGRKIASDQFEVKPLLTTSYCLEAYRGSEFVVKSRPLKIEVTGFKYPKVHTFKANPAKVQFGKSAYLEYDFEHANKAQIKNLTGADPKKRIVVDFRDAGGAGRIPSLNGKRINGKELIENIQKTNIYVLEIENDNGKQQKNIQITVEGYPLAGYDFEAWRSNFLGAPYGDVHIQYELGNLEWAEIQHLDVDLNGYVSLRKFSNLMGKSRKETFDHKPSKDYYPARYRLLFKSPQFNNVQKVEKRVK